MRKRNLFITAFLCILTLSIQAQENYYGKIVDNKQQPISFANVALLNANDSSFVTGVTTDEDGKFGSVLKPSCKSILLSTQFHKYLLPLHHEESPIITLHLSRCTCRLL